jgi:hypothetical protein
MKALAALAVGVAAICTPAARADNGDADFISYLEKHNLGCGEGSIKCSSDMDLIPIGHAVCTDIDVNGQTPVQAAHKLVSVGQNYITLDQADAIVAAALVNYCPWDEYLVTGGAPTQ